MNGTALAIDSKAPYSMTFTVPSGLSRANFAATARDAAGNLGKSAEITVSVIADPLTALRGRVVNSQDVPLAGAEVIPYVSGLRAEYFDFDIPLTEIPKLSELEPDKEGWVSAVNVRNPDQHFGNDPFGVAMTPDYAARLSGLLWVERPGTYTFVLGADEGARFALNGITLLQMPTGNGEFVVYSQTVELAGGLIPIAVTYYESVGDAELQLAWIPPGGELEVVPPEVLLTRAQELRAVTDSSGDFVIPGVPANVAWVRVQVGLGRLSEPVSPVPARMTDLGVVVVGSE